MPINPTLVSKAQASAGAQYLASSVLVSALSAAGAHYLGRNVKLAAGVGAALGLSLNLVRQVVDSRGFGQSNTELVIKGGITATALKCLLRERKNATALIAVSTLVITLAHQALLNRSQNQALEDLKNQIQDCVQGDSGVNLSLQLRLIGMLEPEQAMSILGVNPFSYSEANPEVSSEVVVALIKQSQFKISTESEVRVCFDKAIKGAFNIKIFEAFLTCFQFDELDPKALEVAFYNIGQSTEVTLLILEHFPPSFLTAEALDTAFYKAKSHGFAYEALLKLCELAPADNMGKNF